MLIDSINIMRSSDKIELYGCGWSTASLGAAEMAVVREHVRDTHASCALVASCQRLEAFGTERCSCEAPLKWQGGEALRRIAAVAAGLDSAVLGEEQIMGQVRTAFVSAAPSVCRLASVAIAAARELRRDTAFDSHAGHLLDRGLNLAGMEPGGPLVVLGTGAMGRLVATRAVELGFEPVFIAGRSEPADAGTKRWHYVALDRVTSVGPVAVVVGCLGSAAGEMTLAQLPPASLLLDLGTPRNFPANEGILTIANLLSHEEGSAHTRPRRLELSQQLDAILNRRLERQSEDGNSPVGTLRREVEEIRRREVERMRKLHPEVAEDLLDLFSRSLVDRLLHRPSRRLRELNDGELGQQLVALFTQS
jgi:glutamyl-tRNA reductase